MKLQKKIVPLLVHQNIIVKSVVDAWKVSKLQNMISSSIFMKEARWPILVVLEEERLRQNVCHVFEATLCYTVGARPARVTEKNGFKHENNKPQEKQETGTCSTHTICQYQVLRFGNMCITRCTRITSLHDLIQILRKNYFLFSFLFILLGKII